MDVFLLYTMLQMVQELSSVYRDGNYITSSSFVILTDVNKEL